MWQTEAAGCCSLKGFLNGMLLAKGPGLHLLGDLKERGWATELVLDPLARVAAPALGAVCPQACCRDAPGACTPVWYLSGGCPWCVHFIYDEYYMANLLSVLNSSWGNFARGVPASAGPG